LSKQGSKTNTIWLPPIAVAALATLCPDHPAHADSVFLPACGTCAIVAGLSKTEVQALLRHRNISTTQRYVHLGEGITGQGRG
jgi:integrase